MQPSQIDKVVTDLISQLQYKYKDISKRDITAALSYFKELSPKPERYVYPNGQVKELITLTGTIPVSFKGSRYNIPVQLYMSDLHPYTPPIAYVRPTSDMSINVSETVDSNGRVMLPCLSEWNYPHSDLYMLLNFMAIRFGEHTPLFAKSSKPTPATVTPSPTPPPPAANPLPYPTDSRPPYPVQGYNSGMPSYQMPGSAYTGYGAPQSATSG